MHLRYNTRPMPESNMERRLSNNVAMYPLFAGLSRAFAWMPVFFLYFSERLSDFSQVVLLESVYYLAVPILEVPSGYFSDRVGRKPTLLISTVAFALAYVFYVFGDNFTVLAMAQVLLAAGISFNSGTDTSFHYDSLAMLNRQKEYDDREAVAERNGLIGGALAALGGGAVAVYDTSAAYVLSFVIALACLVIVFRFVEPRDHEKQAPEGQKFTAQVLQCIGFMKKPVLLWLFVFALLMTVINHIPWEYYQPYIGQVSAARGSQTEKFTPLMSGGHMFVAMLIGAFAARRSIRWRDRVGIVPAMLSATVIQTIIIAAMAFYLHWAIVVLVVLRSVPGALGKPPLNAAIAPRVPQSHRATYFSLQSLAGRLSFSATLFAFSFVPDPQEAVTREAMATMLTIGACIGVAGLILLIIGRPLMRDASAKTAEAKA